MSQCIVCLEEAEAKPLELQCSCKLAFHEKCWSLYIEGKEEIACPLCKGSFVLRREEKERKLWAVPIVICAFLFLINLSIIGFVFSQR